MRASGVDSVRFQLSWADVEAQPGEYEWSRPDELIGELAAAGVSTLPFLFGSPQWAARADGNDCEGGGCRSFAPASPETRAAFAGFAAAAVRRYGPYGSFWEAHPGLRPLPVRSWQIWNEPNLRAFFQPAVDATQYGELLHRAAAQIRDEDPTAEVLIGGLSGWRTTANMVSSGSYLRDLYAEAGAAEDFDGLAIHPYWGRVRGVLARVRHALRIARAADPDVGLWITEIGWSSAGRRGEYLVKTAHGQARRLRHAFERFLANRASWRLRGAYWYAWRDTSPALAPCAWCPGAGLVDRAGAAKPALRRFERVSLQR
jgi:hypothetical protein